MVRFTRIIPLLVAFATAWAMSLALTASALAGGLYSPQTLALAEQVLGTRAGSKFARALLGPHVERFNPRATHEVLQTLMHPDNRLLAESFEGRLKAIGEKLAQRRKADDGQPEKILVKRQNQLLEKAARELLSLKTSSSSEGWIVFKNGETYYVRTAYSARRAEFLMGGETVGLQRHRPRTLEAPPKGYEHDAFEQLLQWEQQAGLRPYRETEQFFGLKVTQVDSSFVQIAEGSTLPEEIRALFVRDAKVFWPTHPYNSEMSVPFVNGGAKAVAEEWPARLTASRSVVIWDRSKNLAFSLKAPTDLPHRTELQPGKAQLKDDIDSALKRSEYLDRMDAKLGADPQVTMLREILTGAEKVSGNGFVVRDLRPLLDGNYYVPALSIPFVGEGIAQANGVAFERFWGKAYAELLGRSKARLLVRYGLQMETPNAQNMLIQLDRQLRPTGKLVFRDVSDSYTVEPVLKAIGEGKQIAADIRIGYKPDKHLDAMTDNSFWRMDEDPVSGLGDDLLARWMKIHDQAYIDEVLRLTGHEASGKGPSRIRTIRGLERWLFSEKGLQGLRQYHRALRAAAKSKK